MRSTFFGFDIARRALQSQQRALDITGHNIANAATPGYSRQRAMLTATNPYTIPSMHSPHTSGQVGTGVEVSAIYRLRDGFTDYQYRSENQSLGKWEAHWQTLERVEGIFAEPASAGLKTAIGEFFNSWQDLSKDGGSDTVRAIVRQRGAAVSDMFRHIHSQLSDAKADLDAGISLTVQDINSLAEQIASLNGQIQTSELSGYHANDLRDKRDLLVDQLSKLVEVSAFEQNGQLAVVVQGTSLVRHESVTPMVVSQSEVNGVRPVVWLNSLGEEGLPVNVSNGRLAGMIESRDQVMQDYMGALDELAREFANAVNEQHHQGFYLSNGGTWEQGLDFFAARDGQPIGAGNMDLNALLTDTEEGRRYIAAAGAAQVSGDGTNALAMGQLRNKPIAGLGGTIEQRFEGMLGTLGVDGQQAERKMENQTHLVEQLQMRREAVSGVSLDEEMTEMIRFQHAYNAAARLVTTMDEVLDTLINRTGLR